MTPSTSFARTTDSLRRISGEVDGIVERIVTESPSDLDRAAERIRTARRVFVLGAGRSGLALQMTAMRLMHLGLDAHVVGEATSPAITGQDVLLVASGSGTTAGIVRAASTAAGVGAGVVAITTDRTSPLGELADVIVVIPAATKQDHAGVLSTQYSGGLFEQSLVLVGDALFDALWKMSGATAEELWPRHANLE
ncbi:MULTISPECIES: 6-phospho-3-hexuloisomerase [unclassified Cryobacterium]|uniref:6-phospho-3-hexuloisomerase n=1 Tax=unclassified Cryobacterium TaxID=2649013 RepID=UPI002AB56712|nr:MULTISPECIES: 6-phospho-3-hexuloisomerase [unclassified Cryobacterium]MDY7526817.1 6-phospho-3-hexuloisomerase [Cryobacterium sp. 10C2]MEB0003753.1 6-phospho-3-hexuloisomerase [Cryobacterium sp. RTC2.1]MEB0201122.1 6-phospho-3-hexuloisomerase [Cryobacterium sp. 5I3]MEB0288026.1 6-phospho-3-hexuloisomerase [Cryobacterium sp. 10S3]MEB0291581.1 6-phospho-3-hexuloisomerase [Cryobacterium sp. 10C2]